MLAEKIAVVQLTVAGERNSILSLTQDGLQTEVSEDQQYRNKMEKKPEGRREVGKGKRSSVGLVSFETQPPLKWCCYFNRKCDVSAVHYTVL